MTTTSRHQQRVALQNALDELSEAAIALHEAKADYDEAEENGGEAHGIAGDWTSWVDRAQREFDSAIANLKRQEAVR